MTKNTWLFHPCIQRLEGDIRRPKGEGEHSDEAEEARRGNCLFHFWNVDHVCLFLILN